MCTFVLCKIHHAELHHLVCICCMHMASSNLRNATTNRMQCRMMLPPLIGTNGKYEAVAYVHAQPTSGYDDHPLHPRMPPHRLSTFVSTHCCTHDALSPLEHSLGCRSAHDGGRWCAEIPKYLNRDNPQLCSMYMLQSTPTSRVRSCEMSSDTNRHRHTLYQHRRCLGSDVQPGLTIWEPGARRRET